MIVYVSEKASFRKDAMSGRIEDKIQERMGRRVADNEVRAWQQSLTYMNVVLEDDGIPNDAGICIELGIPQTSKRIDFIVSGYDSRGSSNAVIIELKQWESAQLTGMDGIVRTYLGGGMREVNHPSYQAWSYAALLNDFNEAVYSGGIQLHPCAYLHNYKPDSVIKSDFYAQHVSRAPTFVKTEVPALRDFIKRFIIRGDQADILYRVESGRIRPSKMLADCLASMLTGNREFVMIDEQKLAFEKIMSVASRSNRDRKAVVIVKGGPGTGKSVIAVNLLVQLTGSDQLASYVTKNSAPREVYTARLAGTLQRNRIKNLFRSSGAFTEVPAGAFDTLIVDEAHRLNEKSGIFRNLGENQIKELIHASKTAVFFIDEDQAIDLKDIGQSASIREWAARVGAEVHELELVSQFRCNGSDGYLAWLDDVLQVRETANWDLKDVSYDFRVFDSPTAMFDAVKERNREANKSRVVAGYCWDWRSKSDPQAFDISFPDYGFAKRWNLADDGMLWLIKDESIEEIGCVHTCQGLELDVVGVIIGPDFRVRDGKVVTDVTRRSRRDKTVSGWRALMQLDQVGTERRLRSIIQNTYRTLMTRGMKGCYIYSDDAETRDWFRTRAGLPNP
jgi:DUF2075 family protein